MAKNGKLYESDFEEALVDLFEEVGGNILTAIPSAGSLQTH